MNNIKKEKAKQMKSEGLSYTQIANNLGVKKSTAWDWVNDRKRNVRKHSSGGFVIPTHIGNGIYENEDDQIVYAPAVYVRNQDIKVEEDTFEDIKDFIASLAPIQYPAPPIPSVYKEPNKYAMVIGDTHFGSEDWNVINLFLQTVEEIKPAMIVLNGDMLDMFAVSRYPKDMRTKVSLLREREEYHKFLKMLHDITAPYQTKIYETNANHSGDGTQGRWWRYLSDRIGELSEIPEVIEYMSYKNVFHPKSEWNRVELVDTVEICSSASNNHFIIMHGDVVRSKGAYSARAILEKWHTSVMVNHTHRVGMTPLRRPAIGSRKEQILRAYENGCACNLTPSYASAADWQNAFSIINYSDSTFSVETPVVTNKTICVSTLGKMLKA